MPMNDPVTITPVSEFTSPVLAPSAATVANAGAVAEPVQALANRDLWLRDRVASFIPESGGSEGEFIYPTPPTRIINIPLFSAWYDPDPAGWSRPSNLESGRYWQSAAADAPLVFALNPHLPHGAQITSVKVCVDPDTAHGSTADRIIAVLQSAQPFFGATPVTPTINAPIAQATDDGTAARQTITITPGSPLVLATEGASAQDYDLVIYASAEASGDRVHGVQVTFTDPGPRNY